MPKNSLLHRNLVRLSAISGYALQRRLADFLGELPTLLSFVLCFLIMHSLDATFNANINAADKGSSDRCLPDAAIPYGPKNLLDVAIPYGPKNCSSRRGFLCARSSRVSVERHLLQLPISTQQHVCAMQSCRCEDVASNSRLSKSLAPLDFVHCTGIGRFRRVGHPSIMNSKQRNHLLLFSRYNPCFSPLIPGFCREILKEILHLTILFLILLLIESSNLHLTC